MKKYRLRMLRYNNYKSFEEKLSKMAKKGWFLDSVGTFLWAFKKDEPRRLTYDISFFPDGADIDYYRTEEQETFLEYCEDSGWKLVGTDGKVHVFATDAENPVPIENDEQLKFENLHRCMKKSPVFNWIPIVLVQIIFSFLELDIWRKALADPEMVFTYEFFSSISLRGLFPLVAIYSLIDYGIWYISAKRALSKGLSYEREPSKLRRIIEKILAYIMLIALIVVYIGTYLNGYRRDILMFSIMTLTVVIIILITGVFLKKSKMDKENKDIIFFVMICIAIIAGMFVVDFFVKF
ncbi:DUF2812 domain-containing protein [Alloiococcus sp. CFN-8]|uniref:DUF2812 domain-containing protein n=1 Tax=Alloiococcus sp. CFN-8 TaxID=3416081 RepID=UPI003CF6F049